jgi:hypothetical protein
MSSRSPALALFCVAILACSETSPWTDTRVLELQAISSREVPYELVLTQLARHSSGSMILMNPLVAWLWQSEWQSADPIPLCPGLSGRLLATRFHDGSPELLVEDTLNHGVRIVNASCTEVAHLTLGPEVTALAGAGRPQGWVIATDGPSAWVSDSIALLGVPQAEAQQDSLPPFLFVGPGVIILGRRRAPFPWFAFDDQSLDLRFSALPSPEALKDAGPGQWRATSVLALEPGRGFLQTLTDLSSDHRVFVRFDPEGVPRRSTVTEAAMGFVYSNPTQHTLLALRRTDRQELVTYTWNWASPKAAALPSHSK